MSPRKSKPRMSRTGNGCGFSAVVGLIAIALLIFNGIFVQAILKSNLGGIDERIFHPIQFMAPIAMIFAEFWMFDRIVRYFENRNAKRDTKRKG